MIKRISKGNLEDILSASRDGMKISLLRKSFDGQILKGINLIDSMFARCSFKSSSIYGSNFDNCDFVQCYFTLSDLYHLNFKNCRFNECDFSESKFDQVIFDETCTLNNCKFSGVDLSNPSAISGINPKDLNIVSEQTESIKILLDLGFVLDESGSYVFSSVNNPDTAMYVYFDTEVEIYRVTVMSNGQSYFTYDLDDIFEYTVEEMKRVLINSLKISIRKAQQNDDNEGVLKLNSIFNDFNVNSSKK